MGPAGVAQSVEQLICNQPVAGSSPIASFMVAFIFLLLSYKVMATQERFPSGQREQTVNLSADAFGGSNPPLSTKTFENPPVFKDYHKPVIINKQPIQAWAKDSFWPTAIVKG